jgi:hypothetical protein
VNIPAAGLNVGGVVCGRIVYAAVMPALARVLSNARALNVFVDPTKMMVSADWVVTALLD